MAGNDEHPANGSVADHQQKLIDSLSKTAERHNISAGIVAAFAAVPRHRFLPGVPLEQVYSDNVVPLKKDRGGMFISSSSQPTMMAIMLDQLNLQPGDNVLEIGTASGYNAALMQHLVGPKGRVTTVEIEKDLAKQATQNLARARMGHVTVVNSDGAQGYAPRAAYDHIISTVAVWDIPQTWLTQLKPGGTLVAPIWLDGVQVSAAFRAQPDGTYLSTDNRPCSFVLLRGQQAGPELRVQIGSSPLYIVADGVNKIDTAALALLLTNEHTDCQLLLPLTAGDYHNGFQLYLMLHEPDDFVFAVFVVPNDHRAFGLEGSGIALFGPVSAAFAAYHDKGAMHCYGSSEAQVTMQALLDAWQADGKPRSDRLRLRLIPQTMGQPQIETGKSYTRRHHDLAVWLADNPEAE